VVFGHRFRLVARRRSVLELLDCRPVPSFAAQAFDARDGLSSTRPSSWTPALPLTRAGVLSASHGGALRLDECRVSPTPPTTEATASAARLEILDSMRTESNVRLTCRRRAARDPEVDANSSHWRVAQLRLLTNDGPLARNAQLQGVRRRTRKLRRSDPSIGRAITCAR